MADLDKTELALGSMPALIVVDMIRGFTSVECPLGSECDRVKSAIVELLEIFRQKKWPVYFTTVEYSDSKQASVFRAKLPALEVLQSGSIWTEIDPDMDRQKNEPIIVKHWASAFFKTDLDTRLEANGVDSLVVVGLTTSGCVRATCVDGLQHNYPVFLPEEGTGDRNTDAHQSNLHDLNMKYIEVISIKSLKEQLLNKEP
ncbi:MAG: isochorismatase family protein [Gammaproteobacteria bacterium]|nr:isochorismatase family protein [Gammaproteobacteria bacterium]MDH5629111.1 isochorismatase family protein [Gammaproteobacteria bacterium]